MGVGLLVGKREGLIEGDHVGWNHKQDTFKSGVAKYCSNFQLSNDTNKRTILLQM